VRCLDKEVHKEVGQIDLELRREIWADYICLEAIMRNMVVKNSNKVHVDQQEGCTAVVVH
jgi:hypothetical protein